MALLKKACGFIYIYNIINCLQTVQEFYLIIDTNVLLDIYCVC